MMKSSRRFLFLLLVPAVLATCSSIANASEQTSDSYACVTESQPIPPYPYVQAAGRGDFALSPTNELSYVIYDCFAYIRATELHIHGPAVGGGTAPVIFTIAPGENDHFWTGVLGTLDNQQLHDLNCGLWYLDYHMAEYPDAVARGQMRGLWGWSPPWPCLLATEASTWGSVKSMYR